MKPFTELLLRLARYFPLEKPAQRNAPTMSMDPLNLLSPLPTITPPPTTAVPTLPLIPPPVLNPVLDPPTPGGYPGRDKIPPPPGYNLVDDDLNVIQPVLSTDSAPNELIFPGYSLVSLNPAPIPGLTGKLLAALHPRSPHWDTKRRAHVAAFPFCAVCGFTLHLNVHHVIPFHERPDLELVDENLITLGEFCPYGNHHFFFGHFLNWHKSNPDIRQIAAKFLAAIRAAAA